MPPCHPLKGMAAAFLLLPALPMFLSLLDLSLRLHTVFSLPPYKLKTLSPAQPLPIHFLPFSAKLLERIIYTCCLQFLLLIFSSTLSQQTLSPVHLHWPGHQWPLKGWIALMVNSQFSSTMPCQLHLTPSIALCTLKHVFHLACRAPPWPDFPLTSLAVPPFNSGASPQSLVPFSFPSTFPSSWSRQSLAFQRGIP